MKKDKLNEYNERHRFWTEQALSQFGAATGFFYLISIGFLTFLIESNKKNNLFYYNSDSSFSSFKFLLILSIIAILFSLVMGSLTVLSRLHDLRLSRHKTLVRKKYYKKLKKTLPDGYIDIDKYTFWIKMKLLYNTMTTRPTKYFIIGADYDNKEIIHKKFESLRKRNLQIARLSWSTLNFQILFISISVILFFIASIVRSI